MRPLNIAHRGGAQLMPENSLAAFADAVARGCDGAELDVQLSADGKVVVYHDYRLNPGYTRLRGGDWLKSATPRVKDLSLEQLDRYAIGAAKPGSDYALKHPLRRDVGDQTIPTLDSVIALVKSAPDFRLLVELKCGPNPDSADPIALSDTVFEVVAKAGFLARTIFVGFDWRALVPLVAQGAACWFSTDKLSGDARPVIDMIAGAGVQGWFPNFPDATPENVAYARRRGLRVGAWTVNDPADMRRLMDLDAICTDRPDLLKNLPSP